ncbi:hydrolase [Rhizohabitans arisaemae]|uniref:hydrolase n=1 Tax=Rhizohabitans arisaemae TaxID=2720610 RepID=UPI0024B1D224|nr:hydrolase [Rhizohabitans arisaemae]
MPRRDPEADHLLTPENSALILIDYQPPQIYTVRSMPTGDLIGNVVALARTARRFGLPIVLSTVNVETGVNEETVPQLRGELSGIPSIDRTSINSWEDREFVDAVKATGRRKLIIGALWTEACLLFPTLDALREGYEVYPVVDALGGTTVESHRSSLARVHQAGAQLTTWNSVACELQRDWARRETVQDFVKTAKEQGDAWGWYLTFTES